MTMTTFRGSDGRTYAMQGGAQNFRAAFTRLQQRQAEYQANYALMSPYERMKEEQAIAQENASLVPVIVSGARAALGEAKESYKSAVSGKQRAATRAQARWKADEVAHWGQMAELTLTRAETLEDVERAWNEALTSKNDQRIKATSEIFAGAVRQFQGSDRIKANRIASEARRKRDELNYTDDMQSADEHLNKAAQELINTRDLVLKVGDKLDYDLVRAVSKVRVVNQSYSPETGYTAEIEIEE